MDIETWIQLGLLILAVAGLAVTVVVAAAKVYGKLCAVIVNQESMAANIRRLFELWDSRPCDRHATSIKELQRRMEVVEKEIH